MSRQGKRSLGEIRVMRELTLGGRGFKVTFVDEWADKLEDVCRGLRCDPNTYIAEALMADLDYRIQNLRPSGPYVPKDDSRLTPEVNP